ncbi:thioredoxin family protein [Patescibacteria group bacterium]|nr:thioredoxin family protein [Patescibacteria group bacterium]MBU4512357.1 thioredoxin family protein [Patescibacteria group bacterium]MCG2692783.1 thioredoxin family protein [Candidatus Parcubacteria bacterium]
MENEQKEKKKSISAKTSFALGLAAGLVIFGLVGFVMLYSMFKDEQAGEAPAVVTEQTAEGSESAQQQPPAPQVQALPSGAAGIDTFMDSGEPACKESGKPVIRLFSTTSCPHCTWIKETFDELMREYMTRGKIIAYHWELDMNDNTLTQTPETSVPTAELAIYRKFNPEGYVPTFVFGCKYWRIGNGYESQQDLVAEEAEFRAVIEELLK